MDNATDPETDEGEYPVAFMPIGGIFEDRFWPVTPEQLDDLQITLGWELPADYRRWVTKYGACEAGEFPVVRRDDGKEEPELWVLFGDCEGHSILHPGSHWPETQALTIGSAAAGLFHLRADGSVFYEHSGRFPDEAEELSGVVADSFTDFLHRLKSNPDA